MVKRVFSGQFPGEVTPVGEGERGVGMPADRQTLFETQFADLDRRRQRIEGEYQTGLGALGQAQEAGEAGARRSSLMPVYAMAGRGGLADAYGGGHAQAAAAAGLQAARRGAELGATFATQRADMGLARTRETENIAAAQTALEQQEFDKTTEQIQTDMAGIRSENYTDWSYMSQLLKAAKDQPEGSRARRAYLEEANRMANADFMAGRVLAWPGNQWMQTLLQEIA